MQQCHQNIWLIEPLNILLKKMQDLTVGHVYLLEALESPFLTGADVDMADLVTAVMVCSKPFDEARKFLMLPESKLFKICSRWGFWCRIKRVDIPDAIEQMRDYISEYTNMPEMWEDPDSKPQASSLPRSVKIVWCLMSKMSEREAWDCQFSRALAYMTAELEYNGSRFVTEEQAKVIGA